MPGRIPELPPPSSLVARRVGNTVSANHLAATADALAFLLGHCVVPVVNVSDIYQVAGGASAVYFTYRRTFGVQALRLVCEAGQGAGSLSSLQVELTKVSGAGTIGWFPAPGGVTVATNNGIDGSGAPALSARRFNATSATLRDYPLIEAFVDVSDLTIGSLVLLKLVVTDPLTSVSLGLFAVAVAEVPPAYTDPVADYAHEIGVDPAWTQSGNPLLDGGATSPRGVQRVVLMQDQARFNVRRKWQLTTSDLDPWTRNTAGLGALQWGLALGASDDPVWVFRARRLRTGVSAAVRFGALYKWAPSKADRSIAKIRLTSDSSPFGGAGTTTIDLPINDTAGGWVLTHGTGTLLTDGAPTGDFPEHMVQLTISARPDSQDGGGVATDNLEIIDLWVEEEEA